MVSLWQAKEVLRKGFKWILGDGTSIRVLEDPWIRGKDQYMVDGTYDSISSGLKVCELFAPGESRWDDVKVNSLFSNCDAKAILAIPVPRNQVSDHIAWMHTVDGKYTVKSGYSFWHKHFSECRQGSAHKGWSKLWNLEIPQKVKVFLWRICRNNLPVHNLLRGRGVNTTILCPMCGVDVEHLLHIFLDCKFAKECWRFMELDFNTDAIESCPDWMLQYLVSESQEKSIQMATVLWGIWVARNMTVWENKSIKPDLAMQWSAQQTTQWREAQALKASNVNGKMQGQQQSVARWMAPEEGQFKINVDASVQEGCPDFSIGMVLRDHMGRFCNARVMRLGGEVTVFEAEARGVLEAARWAVELDVSNVILENDSMLTVQALTRGDTNYLEVGNMLQECRSLLNDHPDFSVKFVRKHANKVAHLLARVPCNAYCFHDFVTPPQSVLECLMYDAL